MKGLPTLIRVRSWELEEKRRELARLEAKAAAIVEEIEEIDASVVREQRAAAASFEVAYAYPAFAKAAIELRREREITLEQARREVDLAAEAVTIAYQELKKLEVAQANHEKREAAEMARRDQIRLDEIALEGFRRAEGAA